MPINVLRLRHWVAGTAVLAVIVVAGAYFYARHRVQNALKSVPEKIAQGIQQSAHGFTFSKSEQGRTLFKIQAREVVQFKLGGHAELRDVTITLYGRDSSRFDQIYGADFDYDPQSGDVSAKGEVQIDLEANPAGLANSDQSTPKELKNPIHLKTSGLVFNQKTQDAHTNEKVEFRIPQASGSAQGVSYSAKTRTLMLEAQINLEFSDPVPMTLSATRGIITDEPRQVVLQNARMQREKQTAETEQATIVLRSDNNVDRLLADGGVRIHSAGVKSGMVRADHAELVLGATRGQAKMASLAGHVELDAASAQEAHATAGHVTLDFAANNVVRKVRADQGVKILQRQKPATATAASQNVELTAPAIDFFLSGSRHLSRAETSPGAQIDVLSAAAGGGETHITAHRFDAQFNSLGQLTTLHGAPGARVISTVPGKPARISTSDNIDVSLGAGGIDTIVQQGNVAYSDGSVKAWANLARYTPADQIVRFSGSPRVEEGGMTTTALNMRVQRLSGDAFAEGDVKTTYSDLKAKPGGALLASASPIHVTAASMAVRASGAATFTGNVRLWQDANLISAAKIDFDRNRRSVLAAGSANQSVLTNLVQTDKQGRSTPISISSTALKYIDDDHMARFEGGVQAKASDFILTAEQMDVLLQPSNQTASHQSLGGAGRLDRIIARGQVRVRQATRHGEGDQLIYIAGEDKFVLTGGPPSIFDAEHGKITGVSLTLFRSDDRVLVEGNGTSPSVTQTRVAR